MEMTALVQKYDRLRTDAFAWRDSLAFTKRLALALGFATLTGLMAQIRFPLPFTPVPVTGQTLAVLLAGVFMGRHWGGISMALYAIIGAAGVPWFAGFSGGTAILAGPTGGYIFGFILTALFLGHVTDRYIQSRNFWPMALLMSFATLFLIFLPGLLQLAVWAKYVQGDAVSFSAIMMMGFVPFVPGAIVKIALAAGITKTVTPKK